MSRKSFQTSFVTFNLIFNYRKRASLMLTQDMRKFNVKTSKLANLM
jgi:hypothetical protein